MTGEVRIEKQNGSKEIGRFAKVEPSLPTHIQASQSCQPDTLANAIAKFCFKPPPVCSLLSTSSKMFNRKYKNFRSGLQLRFPVSLKNTVLRLMGKRSYA